MDVYGVLCMSFITMCVNAYICLWAGKERSPSYPTFLISASCAPTGYSCCTAGHSSSSTTTSPSSTSTCRSGTTTTTTATATATATSSTSRHKKLRRYKGGGGIVARQAPKQPWLSESSVSRSAMDPRCSTTELPRFTSPPTFWRWAPNGEVWLFPFCRRKLILLLLLLLLLFAYTSLFSPLSLYLDVLDYSFPSKPINNILHRWKKMNRRPILITLIVK